LLFSNAVEGLSESEKITTFEYELAVQEGTRYFEARMSVLNEGNSIIAVIRDITSRRNAEDKITHQAYFDSLTDLPNRALLHDRLTQLLHEARRLSFFVGVVFLDLDDFKLINDSLGHETGDKLLIDTALRLKDCVREVDTVSRLGGDEFIILLSNLTSPKDINGVADSILNCFEKPFTIDERELMVSASIGISVFPGDGDNTSDLLRNADSAMYHAKAAGRNCFSFYTDSMNQEISRRLAIEEQLYGALDRGEFEVYYQPQFEVASGKLIGAEALLRWTSPKLGSVSPSEFIPVAEQTGTIVALGEFVLSEALILAKSYTVNLDDFRIAVNLSPRQFRDANLVNFIQSKLDDAGIKPERLELEITEGVLLGGSQHVYNTLKELHSLGICIAMDDFGTGYSSLNYLRKYPFNILKIDRSFVNDMTLTNNGSELIKAMVGMSHGLQMKVIAEGVETPEQFAMLKSIGCDNFQGYLFGRPMPRKDFENIDLVLPAI
jgi:diguanylate cyclase (GGDEF)-like protein